GAEVDRALLDLDLETLVLERLRRLPDGLETYVGHLDLRGATRHHEPHGIAAVRRAVVRALRDDLSARHVGVVGAFDLNLEARLGPPRPGIANVLADVGLDVDRAAPLRDDEVDLGARLDLLAGLDTAAYDVARCELGAVATVFLADLELVVREELGGPLLGQAGAVRHLVSLLALR